MKISTNAFRTLCVMFMVVMSVSINLWSAEAHPLSLDSEAQPVAHVVYEEKEYDLVVAPNHSFDLLPKAVDLSLQEESVFTGVVRLYKKETPLKGTELTFKDETGKEVITQSNRDGEFTVRGLKGNKFIVFASLKKHELNGATISIAGPEVKDLTIIMAAEADVMKMVFSVLGGLGIFLLGMRYMSDGLQTVSGPSLKRMISLVTDNRFLATGVGVAVTCFVQSSSITTVMAVGFVNSGIMALNQAIGVILGANIGTTITGWILVLKIGKWGLPLIGVFAFIFLFSKREKLKYFALVFIGVGMVFFGLELMKNGFKPIRSMPEFSEMFALFQATSYLNVLKIAAVGCILTMIVQSSSATLGITIGLASTGVIGFETAAALVLGENIGTTITALLASIGTTTNARRAAYFHALFNVAGVLWITAIFQYYLPLVISVVGHDPNMMVMKDGSETYPYITAGIASTHTIFNIVNTLIFLPFTGYIANFLMKFVKDAKVKPAEMITNLQYSMIGTPYASVQQSKLEIDKMEVAAKEMMDDLKKVLSNDSNKDILMKKIFKDEDTLDVMQKEITEFLTEFLSTQIPHDVAEIAKEHLRMCDELESVSDYVMQILKLQLRLEDNDVALSQDRMDSIIDLHDTVKEFFDFVMVCESKEQVQQQFTSITDKSDAITRQIRTLRNDYWKIASEERVNPMVSTTYTDILQSYRKIKNHILNEAEVQTL
ncbi:MAG: Na/Pi cotransporter family protein [Fibrobacterales bacterium]